MSTASKGQTAIPATEAGAVAKGMVRVGTLMPLPGLLREHGVDVGRTLAEFFLDEVYLKDPDNTLPYAIMGLLLSRCAELAQCPHIGLLTGQRSNASSLGTVGFLVRSAPNVRTALHELSLHFQLHNPNATVDVRESDSFAVLRFTLLMPHMGGWEHILDGAMTIAFNMMRNLCGPGWTPSEVRLAHVAPRNVAPYREFFGPAIQFDADESALVFESRWLDCPISTADPLLHLTMAKRVKELELSDPEDLVSQVRRMLPPLVAARAASVGVVANLLGLTTRTLNRRLAEECTTFMRLRDEARHTVACQLLENTRMPANEISDRLGYANPSAFSRAFERWAGKAPAQWRASRAPRPVRDSPDAGRA